MIILSKVHFKCHSFFGWQTLQTRRLVSVDTTISKTGYITVLIESGFSENDSIHLINNKVLQKCKPLQLKKSLNLVQRLGFTKKQILKYPQVLALPSYQINCRVKVLEEIGVKNDKISLKIIQRFIQFRNSSPESLKIKGYIDENIDITKNILSHCDLPIHLYPSSPDDSQLLRIIQVNAVKQYLRWLLDFTQEEIDIKLQMYRLGYIFKSVRLIKETYDILQNHFDFPKETIRQHMYLLQESPERIRDIIERIHFIGSKPLKDIAHQYPKVLMRPVDTILEILHILKEFNIDEKCASQYPKIFSLAPETVRKRIQILITDPQYKYLIHNNCLFESIVTFQQLTKRSILIKDSNWSRYSANILHVYKSIFDKRFKLNPDYYSGTDIVHFLKKKIGMPANEIRKTLSQHVLWNYVPLSTISSTLEFLQQAGFSENQIFSALPVTLYPKSKVEKYLKELDGNQEIDCCRDQSTGKVRSELVLQLVLYYLEQPFHFTGKGIWELDSTDSEKAQ